MCIFVGKIIFYVRTNIVVLSTVDAIHRQNQWTTYLCFAWILRRNFVCISFFPSFLVWPLLPNAKCRVLLPNLITFKETHTRARAHTHTHTHTSRSIERLWMNDRPVAETSTWQPTLFARNIHPRPRRNSKLKSQQARAAESRRRPCRRRDRPCLNLL